MGLTNEVKGVVHSIIYAEGSKTPELPVAVIGTFEHYIGPGWKGMEKEVLIGLLSRKFFSSRKDGTQPMLLGYALSVHKLQGFALGLLLVGANRCRIYSPIQKYHLVFLKKIELSTYV
jgi:hypothetical protein